MKTPKDTPSFDEGLTAQMRGDLESAITIFERVIEERPKDPSAYHQVGRCHMKRGAFEKVLQFTEAKILELVERILSGKIDVSPYRLNQRSPCSYCEYRSACRFDWQINDYNFLESVGKTQVLEKIEPSEKKSKIKNQKAK